MTAAGDPIGNAPVGGRDAPTGERGVERFPVVLLPPVGGHVTAAVHRPVRSERIDGLAALLLPGAGGTLDTPGLVALAEVLAQLGVLVVRANLPYREQGRRTPPRAERNVEAAVAVLAAVEAELAGWPAPRRRWIVGGKSYGCRVASLAVADGFPAAGLLCYGYPLHPPGRPEQLRVAHWPRIDIPCLLLQGGLDPFGAPKELAPFVGQLASGRLEGVAGADHSLRIAAKHSPTARVISETVVIAGLRDVIAEWLDDVEQWRDGARR